MKRFGHIIYIGFLLMVTSCFTGVESTRKITDKEVEKVVEPSREDQFISGYFPQIGCAEWEIGKQFYYTDSLLTPVLRPENGGFSAGSLQGKIFTYAGYREETLFGDRYEVTLRFTSDGNTYLYRTGKTLPELRQLNYMPLIPPFIDLTDVQTARALLKGRVLYVKTPIWYDDSGSVISGRKLIPVTITKIFPGNSVLPIKVRFTDDTGMVGNVFMSLFTSDQSQFITFDRLFSFDDPRLKYKEIQDDVWDSITREKVRTGMTKDECTLSLGLPAEVRKIPTYSGLKEQWYYNSGTYLFFADGLLVDFRL